MRLILSTAIENEFSIIFAEVCSFQRTWLSSGVRKGFLKVLCLDELEKIGFIPNYFTNEVLGSFFNLAIDQPWKLDGVDRKWQGSRLPMLIFSKIVELLYKKNQFPPPQSFSWSELLLGDDFFAALFFVSILET